MKNKNLANQKQQLNKNQTTVNTRNIGKGTNVNTTVQLTNKTNGSANNKGVSDQSSK